MARTQKDHKYIEDEGIWKHNINISEPGEALLTKIIPGSGISVSSTGVDQGTGDVTISATGTPSGVDELVKISATDIFPGFLIDKLVAGNNITFTPQTDPSGDQILQVQATIPSPQTSTQLLSFLFSRKGEVKSGKWLKIDKISTDKVPFSLPRDCQNLKITISNKKDNTGTVRLFKNENLLTDISLVNNTRKTTLLTQSFLTGDLFSAKGISGELEDVTLHFLFETV